jgi:hypothetical protein
MLTYYEKSNKLLASKILRRIWCIVTIAVIFDVYTKVGPFGNVLELKKIKSSI